MQSGPGVLPVAICLIVQSNSVFVIGLVKFSFFDSSFGIIPFKIFFTNCGLFGFSLKNSEKNSKVVFTISGVVETI